MVELSTDLVPGARLCSIRNCTYIIPPMDEYRWKMCAVCRLRRREIRRRIRAQSDQLIKTIDSVIPKSLVCLAIPPKLLSGYLFRYLLQAKMRKREPTLGSGRCRSLDCGMLVVDSMSLDCKQCIARMIWLVSRNHVSIPPIERVCSFSFQS